MAIESQSEKSNHFSSDGHGWDDFSIQVIDVIYPLATEQPHTFEQRLSDREKFWMLEIGSVTPYGLNDNVKGFGNMASRKPTTTSVAHMFNPHKRKSHSHGRRKYNSHLIHSNISVSYIKQICCGNNYIHQLRSILFSLPLELLHQLSVEISNESAKENIPISVRKICNDIATFYPFTYET